MDFVIGTWSFCYDAIKQGEEIFRSQTNCIDTIEKTINCAYIKLDALQITTMQESTFTLHGRYFHFRITSQGQKKTALDRISPEQIVNPLDLYCFSTKKNNNKIHGKSGILVIGRFGFWHRCKSRPTYVRTGRDVNGQVR